MSWKFDVGTPLTIPKVGGGYTKGMVVSQNPDSNNDPYGDRYLVKTDEHETAMWYQRKFLDRAAFVSQLSFKEQRMEEDINWKKLQDMAFEEFDKTMHTLKETMKRFRL